MLSEVNHDPEHLLRSNLSNAGTFYISQPISKVGMIRKRFRHIFNEDGQLFLKAVEQRIGCAYDFSGQSQFEKGRGNRLCRELL